MIQQIHEFIASAVAPVYDFYIPHWNNFIIYSHRVLDPICVKTAHYDEDFGLPPCTSAKFFTLVVLHLTLFFFLARNTDRTPRLLDQHSVLTFPDDEAAPPVDSNKKVEVVGADSFAHRSGLRLRKTDKN